MAAIQECSRVDEASEFDLVIQDVVGYVPTVVYPLNPEEGEGDFGLCGPDEEWDGEKHGFVLRVDDKEGFNHRGEATLPLKNGRYLVISQL